MILLFEPRIALSAIFHLYFLSEISLGMEENYDLCHPSIITENDVLQISQTLNWGKIYGTIYPLNDMIPYL